jgi:type II secretory pathway pseudopilin PulG
MTACSLDRRRAFEPRSAPEAGFTLAELIIATGLLLAVSAIVTSALVRMTNHQQTIWNRTEMHSGVRGATELLQQEVGQAGRITLPGTVTLQSAVAGANPCVTATVTVATDAGGSPTAGMFVNELLTTLDGDNQETVTITAIPSSTQFTACFTANHSIGAVVLPLGGFATGIVPPNIANGSTANLLKLYGDINGDGKMVYIEYYCDNGDAGTTGSFNLYRNVMPFDQAPPKPAVTNAMILLSNVHTNPPDPTTGAARPCFQYQTATVNVNGTPYTFVLDVAVTLTVQTQQIDPITRQYQFETKALLNVSPRNVFSAWELAGINYTNRVQPTPASITALLPSS